MKSLFVATLAAAAGFLLAAPQALQAQDASATFALPAPVSSGYAPVNGLSMYYATYGSGQPLVLLPGGLGSIEMYATIIPSLAAKNEVIAVDLQGQGRTADIDRPLSYQAMADDVAALIRYLGLPRADVMGYSLGGEVALQVAIRHPALVQKLVLVSTAFSQDGWYPQVLASEAAMGPAAAIAMEQTPLYKLFASVAPKPEQWTQIVVKTGDLLAAPYDWTSEVRKLAMPILIVVGDEDAVRLSRTVEMFGFFGGGKAPGGWPGVKPPSAELAVLPNTSHLEIFMSPALPSVVNPFLDESSGTGR